jgi:hypothetical protein
VKANLFTTRKMVFRYVNPTLRFVLG